MNGESIKEKATKIKGYLGAERFGLTLLVLIVAGASFFTGRLSGVNQATQKTNADTPIVMTQKADKSNGASNESGSSSSTVVEAPKDATLGSLSGATTTGAYVGSRRGERYHLPWCAGAKTISEENKIWFASKEEAEAKGYTPAANCKGI